MDRFRFGAISTPWAMAAGLALITRLGVSAGLWLGGLDWPGLTHARDGVSYIAVARLMAGQPDRLHPLDLRVFPGLPAMMAALSLVGIPPGVSGLALNYAGAAGAAALTVVLARDLRPGLAVAVLSPAFLMYPPARPRTSPAALRPTCSSTSRRPWAASCC